MSAWYPFQTASLHPQNKLTQASQFLWQFRVRRFSFLLAHFLSLFFPSPLEASLEPLYSS